MVRQRKAGENKGGICRETQIHSQKYTPPTIISPSGLVLCLPLVYHQLLSLLCVSPTASRDSPWQWWWEYAPLLPSSVIICDRLYGQPRLVTQPHTGLLSIIWLISVLYNALLPTACVNERTVTHSLSGVNPRQDTEHVNAPRQTGWHLSSRCGSKSRFLLKKLEISKVQWPVGTCPSVSH